MAAQEREGLDASGRSTDEQSWLLAGSVLLTLISFLANLFGAKRMLLAVRDFSRRISERGIHPLTNTAVSDVGQEERTRGSKPVSQTRQARSVDSAMPVHDMKS